MAFRYPEFHGRKGEDVEQFLEQMEVACISNRIVDPASILRLLQIYLKGDARKWSKDYEKELAGSQPPRELNLDDLKEALLEEFVKEEDPEKYWHEVQELVQRDGEPVEDYIKKFSLAWERMCEALVPQLPPPDMMKKDKFMAGLSQGLRWRVELKKPRSFEEAVEKAKGKEWKLKKMAQLGVESLSQRPDFQQVAPLQSSQPEVRHVQFASIPQVVPIVPPAPQLMPPVVATTISDDGLRQDMKQVVDLMKNLSLNLLSNAGSGRGQERSSNQPASGVQNSGKRWKSIPTCYNCGELGHISPHCDKPKRMGGDMYPLPAQLPN